MCESFEAAGSALRGKITVEFNRDASMRLTEIVIVNFDREGDERQGTIVWCYDNGTIRGGVDLHEGVDLVGVAEVRRYW